MQKFAKYQSDKINQARLQPSSNIAKADSGTEPQMGLSSNQVIITQQIYMQNNKKMKNIYKYIKYIGCCLFFLLIALLLSNQIAKTHKTNLYQKLKQNQSIIPILNNQVNSKIYDKSPQQQAPNEIRKLQEVKLQQLKKIQQIKKQEEIKKLQQLKKPQVQKQKENLSTPSNKGNTNSSNVLQANQINKTKIQQRKYIQQKPFAYKSSQQYQNIRKQYTQKYLRYRVKADSIPNDIKKPPYWHSMLQKHILPASQFNLSISQHEEFKLMKKQWDSIIPYEKFQFQHDPTLQKEQQKLQISGKFTDLKSIQTFFFNQAKKYSNKAKQSQPLLNMAIMMYSNSKDKLMRQAEYLYLDNKYNIGQKLKQLPMCIISNGYNIASKYRYNKYFDALEILNYTNYRIVILDDNSKDNSIEAFYNYLRNSTLKIKNRVLLTRSLVQIKSTGHLYYGAKYFCKPDQIIVNVDTDDQLIGSQTLKLLNVIYQDPQIWFVHGRYLASQNKKNWKLGQLTKELKVSSTQYRTRERYWVTSHLKTYRQALWKNAPIQYFIQYHYNETTHYYEPIFIDEASDRPIIYYVVQVSGNSRIKFLPFGLYYYYQWIAPPKNKVDCYILHMYYEQYKMRVLTPLQKLSSLDDVPKPVQNYTCPPKLLNQLQVEINKLNACQKKKANIQKMQLEKKKKN